MLGKEATCVASVRSRMGSDLLGILLLVSSKKKTETLQNLSLQDPSLIIETIRCYKDWSITKREDYVLLFQVFSGWLSKRALKTVASELKLDPEFTFKDLTKNI